MKKYLALLLSVAMMVTMMPLSVFAADKNTPTIRTDVIVNDEGLVGGEANLQLSGDDIAKVIIEQSLNAIAKKDPTGLAKWGVGQLLAGLFPKEKDTTLQDMQQMLIEGIQRLDELQRSVNKLADQISLSDIYSHLNDYSAYVNRCITPIKPLINTLDSFDDPKADTQPDDSMLARNRRKVLTTVIGLNASNMATINEVAFDQNYYELYSLITTKYKVDVSGESKELGLFQMYREGMRYLCDWENQAWDAMDAYDVSVMNTYLSYATLRLESLDARKHELLASEQEKDEHAVEIQLMTEEIKNMQEQVETVRALYEAAVVDRDADYRYYWKPGYEARFSATLYTMNQVQEDESKISEIKDIRNEVLRLKDDEKELVRIEKLVYECPDSGKNWPNSVGYANKSADLTYNIWYPAEGEYNADNMPTTAAYNKLLDSYNYKKSLGEILQGGDFKLGSGTYDNTDENALFMIAKSDPNNPVKLNKEIYGHDRCISEYDFFQPTAYGIKSTQKASVGKGKATQFFKYRYFNLIDWIPQTRTVKKQVWTIDDASSACTLTPYVLQCYPSSQASVAGKVTLNKLKLTKSGKVTVNWNRAYQYDGVFVDKYYIYRSTKKNSGFKKIATVTSKNGSYTVKWTSKSKLKKGKRYYFKIRGIYNNDTGSHKTKWSNVRSIKRK